ncbi:MAG: NUDIX hydrolase [Pirellulales bacterium]|nr:NUDIX hydrolase [Pirellulales bacterium]
MNEDLYPLHNPIEQACAIPMRCRSGQTEVCLITSISHGHWGFPKGIIDPGETAAETAYKEADEEAGLKGSILGEPLGKYQYSKWDTTLSVTVYLMAVTHTAPAWDEADLRERRWATPQEALDLLYRAEHREFLLKALKRWEAMKEGIP